MSGAVQRHCLSTVSVCRGRFRSASFVMTRREGRSSSAPVGSETHVVGAATKSPYCLKKLDVASAAAALTEAAAAAAAAAAAEEEEEEEEEEHADGDDDDADDAVDDADDDCSGGCVGDCERVVGLLQINSSSSRHVEKAASHDALCSSGFLSVELGTKKSGNNLRSETRSDPIGGSSQSTRR